MEPFQALLAVALGSLVGLSLGLVGGGGSILTVPLLVYALGESVTAAVTTSLAIVGINALVGTLRHWHDDRVELRIGVTFGLTGVAGAFAGAWVGHHLAGKQLLFLFALVMLAAAAAMWRRGRRDAQPHRVARPGAHDISLKALATGLAVGVLTGFFGVGGGFVIVPALVLVLGLSMPQAIGTSLLVIAINSAAGLLAHLQYGRIDVAVTVLFAVGGIGGTLVGSTFAGRVDERKLRAGFAYGLVAVAAYLIYQNHPAAPSIHAAMHLLTHIL